MGDEVQEVVQTANRVTDDDVTAAIKEVSYTVLPNGLTTVCQITLYNGFTVEGTSACVDPANFNEQLGREIALRNARDKIWPFLGFRLAERMHSEPKGWQERLVAEHRDLVNREQALREAMQDESFVSQLPEADRYLLKHQHVAMVALASVLADRVQRLQHG